MLTEKKNDKEGKKNQDEKLVSIAVLPFQNQSNDPDQDYFVDGITEDIINNLSLWRTFPVTSSNSSFMYKNKSINVKDVGNELGVRYVVQGSVRKGGQKVRITAQLIDCAEDHQLWSEKWDKNVEDIFDVQDEVSAAIAATFSQSKHKYTCLPSPQRWSNSRIIPGANRSFNWLLQFSNTRKKNLYC